MANPHVFQDMYYPNGIKIPNEPREFSESLSERIMQRGHWNEGLLSVPQFNSSSFSLESNTPSESRMTTIMGWVEAQEINEQISQVSTSSCHLSPFYISEECLPLGNTQPLGQVNSAFQYPMDESFSPIYNPNFAWNPEIYFGTQNFTPYSTQNFSRGNSVSFSPQQNFQQPNLPYQVQSPHPQAVNHTSLDIGHDEHLNALEKDLETMIKASIQATDMLTQTSCTLNSFMQLTGHMLSSNTQAIARLETHLDQLASAMSEGEKENLLSQSVVNPEDTEKNFDEEISEEADQVFQNEKNVSETTCGEIFLDELRFLKNNQQLNFYTSTMTLGFEEILKELVVKEQIFTNQEFKFKLHNTNNTYPTLLLKLLNALECSEFKYIIDFIILKLFKIRGRIFSNKVGFNVECELLMFHLLFYISIFCLIIIIRLYSSLI